MTIWWEEIVFLTKTSGDEADADDEVASKTDNKIIIAKRRRAICPSIFGDVWASDPAGCWSIALLMSKSDDFFLIRLWERM